MNLIAIVAHKPETLEQYNETWETLKTKVIPLRIHTAASVTVQRGYAQTKYSGTLKPEYEGLTALEIAMLCDTGFSWFGGSSSKTGNHFNVTIYID